MNKIDELEFLLELQALTIGNLCHNSIAVNCKTFRAQDKETELEAEIIIKVNKTNWGIAGKYIEEMLHDGKIRDDIDRTIVMRIKEIIENKIQAIREIAISNLGIIDKEWEYKKEKLLEDHQEIGGNTE